jgi:hypothetical protein
MDSYYCKLNKMNQKRNTWSMAFIPLKNFLSIWHLKLIGLIGPRALSERVNGPVYLMVVGAAEK